MRETIAVGAFSFLTSRADCCCWYFGWWSALTGHSPITLEHFSFVYVCVCIEASLLFPYSASIYMIILYTFAIVWQSEFFRWAFFLLLFMEGSCRESSSAGPTAGAPAICYLMAKFDTDNLARCWGWWLDTCECVFVLCWAQAAPIYRRRGWYTAHSPPSHSVLSFFLFWVSSAEWVERGWGWDTHWWLHEADCYRDCRRHSTASWIAYGLIGPAVRVCASPGDLLCGNPRESRTLPLCCASPITIPWQWQFRLIVSSHQNILNISINLWPKKENNISQLFFLSCLIFYFISLAFGSRSGLYGSSSSK